MAWVVTTTATLDEWFAELDSEGQAEVIAKVALLKKFGPMLSRPHADTLNDSKHANMKELRADTARAVLRIAFALDPDRKAILLCAGDKAGVSSRRFYRQLIARADRLYDEHLAKRQRPNKSREQ